MLHLLFEALAYFVAGRLYLRSREGDEIEQATRISVLVAAALGAAVGSKLLYWLEWPRDTLAHLGDFAWLLGGKSIVGGLLGGLVGVELSKWRIGERRSTGDRFVLPLMVGIAVGRVGCFLHGLEDHTAGIPTSLPWGVDFGDGVLRHPTQLYEIAFLALLAPLALRMSAQRSGDRFRVFMVGYLSFRLLVDSLKPDPKWVFGTSAIQVACVVGLVYYARDVRRICFG